VWNTKGLARLIRLAMCVVPSRRALRVAGSYTYTTGDKYKTINLVSGRIIPFSRSFSCARTRAKMVECLADLVWNAVVFQTVSSICGTDR
jgi:hypothetical protein